jgi:hypothetical protein
MMGIIGTGRIANRSHEAFVFGLVIGAATSAGVPISTIPAFQRIGAAAVIARANRTDHARDIRYKASFCRGLPAFCAAPSSSSELDQMSGDCIMTGSTTVRRPAGNRAERRVP